MSKNKPSYINSPSYQNGGKELIGWIGVFVFMFGLMVIALLLTGGNQ